MVAVKIIDGVGYIKKGSIGIGFGAWGRAASIKKQLGLADYPKSVEEQEWQKLTGEVKLVDASKRWSEL